MISSSSATAISLGSNGFHLLSAVRAGNTIDLKNHLHENIQTESFIESNGEISQIGIDRILATLGNFAEHLKQKPSEKVAAIATGTFRKATNSESIIIQAVSQLGYPIKILSGQDESLLCYMGIASAVGLSNENRLVIDIGGASTEIMIANQNRLIQFCSLDVGCVSLTNNVFANDLINDQNFGEAINIATSVIQPQEELFTQLGWSEVMACGGTVSGLFSVLQAKRMAGRFITQAALERFTFVVFESGSANALADSVVTPNRADLLPAGVAILQAIYNQLGIDKLTPVFSSVGQGLLVGLLKDQAVNV